MGFMDKLKELTQPYDDDEDFFEGADPSFKPQPKAKPEAPRVETGGESGAEVFSPLRMIRRFPLRTRREACGAGSADRRRGIFGNLGIKKAARPRTAPSAQ